jgi:hypothetical protein
MAYVTALGAEAEAKPELSAEQKKQLLQAGLKALPDCYSAELDNCFKEPPVQPHVERCDVINAGYDGDWDAMKAAVDALPYCSWSARCPVPGLDWKQVVGGAAFGVAVGLLLGLRGK